MGTLNVTKVSAGNELEGFDVSYQVTVASEGADADGTTIYQSRFADKAVIKAVVKTAEEPFTGFTVAVEPEVASACGVRNLEQRIKADKLEALTQIVNAEFDAAQAVEFIKTVQG